MVWRVAHTGQRRLYRRRVYSSWRAASLKNFIALDLILELKICFLNPVLRCFQANKEGLKPLDDRQQKQTAAPWPRRAARA